jgi:hypothetical protein
MLTHRVLYSDNGTLTDRSLEAKSSTFAQTFVAAEDYLYIGQQFPFNSFYLGISTGNTEAATLGIEYWDGSNWTSVVDILDGTLASGVTMAQSGIVRFSLDKDTRWDFVADSSEESNLGDLENVTIYQMYWIRIKPSADSSAITFNELSYLFTDNDTIENLDPDINQYLSNWESGKTDWTEQILIASKHVVVDLKKKGFIRDQAQILLIDRELELLAAYRALMVIYSGLGGDKFNQKMTEARNEYSAVLQGINVVVDQNNDGILNKAEVRTLQGKPIR